MSIDFNKLDEKEIIKELVEFEYKFDIQRTEYHISHGAALVLMGLKHSTEDIDLTFEDNNKFNTFRNKGYYEKLLSHGTTLISITDIIDIHDQPFNKISNDNILLTDEGFRYTDPSVILNEKLKLNREKDQHWINVLTKHISK